MKKLLATTILAFIILSGCATIESDWERTRLANNIPAYQEFLLKHPQSDFSDQARAKIDELAYSAASWSGSTEGFEQYLKDFPDGKFAEDARANIEKMYFKQASTADTLASYEKYLSMYPSGRYAGNAKEAELRIKDKMSFDQASDTNTIASYEKYLAMHPSGQYASNANEEIERIRHRPLFQACLDGDEITVKKLHATGVSLAGYDEAAKELMSILQRQIPQNVIKMTNNRVMGLADASKPSDKKQALSAFKLLLSAGADPDAMRIKGFEKAGEKYIPGFSSVKILSTGNPGEIVPAPEGGMSALEFADVNGLVEFKKALMSHDRTR